MPLDDNRPGLTAAVQDLSVAKGQEMVIERQLEAVNKLYRAYKVRPSV